MFRVSSASLPGAMRHVTVTNARFISFFSRKMLMGLRWPDSPSPARPTRTAAKLFQHGVRARGVTTELLEMTPGLLASWCAKAHHPRSCSAAQGKVVDAGPRPHDDGRVVVAPVDALTSPQVFSQAAAGGCAVKAAASVVFATRALTFDYPAWAETRRRAPCCSIRSHSSWASCRSVSRAASCLAASPAAPPRSPGCWLPVCSFTAGGTPRSSCC